MTTLETRSSFTPEATSKKLQHESIQEDSDYSFWLAQVFSAWMEKLIVWLRATTPEALLDPENKTLEAYVRQGRIPINLGSLGSSQGDKIAWYQIPPIWHTHKDIIPGSDETNGYYLFKSRFFNQPLTGKIFQLSSIKAAEVEKRIAAESSLIDEERLSQKKRDCKK